jgi:predicted ATPase
MPIIKQDQKLFEIVNHLNRGSALIQADPASHDLLQLNLVAGQKARNATAYEAALDYFNRGIALLRGDYWQQQYNLLLSLYEGATEAAFLTTDFEQMEQLADIVLAHVHSWLDRVTTYEVKIQASIAQNQHLEALRLAREILNHLGLHFPEQPTQADIEPALQHTQSLLSHRSIEPLLGFLQAYASGLDVGDLEYAALSLMGYGYKAYFSGQELSGLKQTMEEHRKVIRQLRQDDYLHIQSTYY